MPDEWQQSLREWVEKGDVGDRHKWRGPGLRGNHGEGQTQRIKFRKLIADREERIQGNLKEK